MELEVGDIVLCTVERIEKTIVFVKIHHGGQDIAGSIVTSEIAPGRIRNIRNYVVPKKKIVCKVLRTSGGRIELSLRRVTQKDKKEVMQEYKQEKSYISVIRSTVGDKLKAKEIVKKIEKEQRLYDFLEDAKTDSKPLEKIAGKDAAEKILNIIKAEKTKKAILKKDFTLRTSKPNGLELIKSLLEKVKDAEIKYISAGKYNIKVESDNIKAADNKISEIFEDLESQAKKQEMTFTTKEKNK